MARRNDDQHLRVIVADDDPIIRQLFSSRLAAMGCDAILAEDGGKAWKLIRSARRIDLAIVDLDMPNVDGFALIQCIRNHPRTRHMPVIVVTSRSDPNAIQEAFASGATSFLTKPLNWSTFGNHIDYLMRLTHAAEQCRSQAQRAEAAVRIKDLVLRRTLEQSDRNAQDICVHLHALAEAWENGEPIDAAMDQILAIGQAAERIQSILGQAQSLTTALCQTVTSEQSRVALINVIANAQTRIQALSNERNVPVFVVRVPDHAYVSCDPEGVALAIGHLLDNAIRYSPEGGKVTLEADVHSDGMLTVTITDDGPGMEPDFYAACLHPTSAEEIQEQAASDGVGLPLVKAIAEAHGGVLEIRSMPNEGTSAMLVIPADRVSIEAEEAA